MADPPVIQPLPTGAIEAVLVSQAVPGRSTR